MNKFQVGDKVKFKDNKVNYHYWQKHYSYSFGFQDILTVDWRDNYYIVPKECRRGLCVYAYRFESVIKSGDQLSLPFKEVF